MLARTSILRLAVPAVILSAGAWCAPAAAGPSNVPFKATVATHETLTRGGACGPSDLVGTTTGTGNASHMGAITFMATDCATLGATFTFRNGNLTITAANGDELKAMYDGMLIPIPNAAPFTLYTISGKFTVTGGTGRFSGASGFGDLRGFENIQTGQGQFDVTGQLSY